MGGHLEALRVHDECRAREVPVWCGGMLETGIGRAANVALAALPGFVLPGDTSASARYADWLVAWCALSSTWCTLDDDPRLADSAAAIGELALTLTVR